MKEVRLNLQRQIAELADTVQEQRKLHISELQRVRQTYADDLRAQEDNFLRKNDDVEQRFREKLQEDIRQLALLQAKEKEELYKAAETDI